MEQSVGKTLREARRERGIELAEVEAATRIRARFLSAIEAEEWDVLPGETYARGFIRAYAAYLGLDGGSLAERHRREVGADRPGEALLGADPFHPRAAKPPRRRIGPRALAAAVSMALIAVLVVIGFSGGEEEAPSPPGQTEAPARQAANPAPPSPEPRAKSGLSLRLTATEEVWVCLLDAGGRALVEGQILNPGAEAGPFRSGSFTVSLGNGEVAMTVNGREASIPSTPSPIGYTIGTRGTLRELSEGERPTCT